MTELPTCPWSMEDGLALYAAPISCDPPGASREAPRAANRAFAMPHDPSRVAEHTARRVLACLLVLHVAAPAEHQPGGAARVLEVHQTAGHAPEHPRGAGDTVKAISGKPGVQSVRGWDQDAGPYQ